MRHLRTYCKTLCFLLFALTAASSLAQTPTNSSSVLDGAGKWTAGGSYSNLSAIAQPSGVSVSEGGQFINSAGFLSTFCLNTNLDHDADTIPDEFDPDNDNDGLSDSAEISGSLFSPGTVTDLNVSDSDGDGHNDREESIAGTDPTDTNALFRLLGFTVSNLDVSVTWVGRMSNTYRIETATNLTQTGCFWTVTTTNIATGGSGPWNVTTNSYYGTVSAGTGYYYRIIVED